MTTTSRMNMTDAELVELSIEGRSFAWEKLIDRHGSLVWAVAHRAGLSRDDAADVFQNTWTIAVEELPRLRNAGRFPAWIARVARHQSMRIRRGYGIARKARDRIARKNVDERVPDEQLVALEERSRVARAFAALGERCADLLKALYYEAPRPGYDRIARRLGMKIGSIGPTRARCLDKLRTRLGDASHD